MIITPDELARRITEALADDLRRQHPELEVTIEDFPDHPVPHVTPPGPDSRPDAGRDHDT